MTLALPNTPADTPIFADMLAGLDPLDAHFMSVPVDTAPAAIVAEIVAVVDTIPDPAPAADEDFADDHVPTGPIGTEAWLWLLAFGVVLGAIIWFAAPPAVVVW